MPATNPFFFTPLARERKGKVSIMLPSVRHRGQLWAKQRDGVFSSFYIGDRQRKRPRACGIVIAFKIKKNISRKFIILKNEGLVGNDSGAEQADRRVQPQRMVGEKDTPRL